MVVMVRGYTCTTVLALLVIMGTKRSEWSLNLSERIIHFAREDGKPVSKCKQQNAMYAWHAGVHVRVGLIAFGRRFTEMA